MTKRHSFILLLTLISAPLCGQSLWSSAELSLSLMKNTKLNIEGEYRTHDKLSNTERIAATLSIDYKLYPCVKLTGGYSYIHQHTEDKTTKRGNIIPAYWQPKHRAFFAINGDCELGRFTFSLRERYQLTHRSEQYVTKYDDDGVTRKKDELIEAYNKHILRSRIEAEYNIKDYNLKPYASYEIYNALSDNFSLDKMKITAGCAYKINKHNAIDLYYRHINESDDDEPAGHIIGIGYSYKF